MERTGDSESKLIERAKKGDVDAFNRLVLLHQDGVYNVAFRLTGSAESAADVSQETFISAFKNLGGFRGGSLRAWLFRIATNAAYDMIRRMRSRPAESLESWQEAPTGSGTTGATVQTPEGEAIRVELLDHVKKGLLTLPPEQRVAVVLVDVQGLSYEEAAVATDVSLGTVKSRLSRGRGHLRKYLQSQGELLPGKFRS